MKRLLAILLLWSALGPRAIVVADPAPLVSVWYRGQPAGIPRAEDLAEIRAQGFWGVTWQAGDVADAAALTRFADAAGLSVVLRAGIVPLTATSALSGDDHMDVDVVHTPTALVAPIVWRAIAHGARVISFDPGRVQGSGLIDRNGQPLVWVMAAADVARQLNINGGFVSQWRVGQAVTIDPPASEALDVVLIDAKKSWVAVATNASRNRARAVVHMPAGVPYALWSNMLNGSTLAMLDQPAGPRWNLDIEAWGVRIDVIDKVLR